MLISLSYTLILFLVSQRVESTAPVRETNPIEENLLKNDQEKPQVFGLKNLPKSSSSIIPAMDYPKDIFQPGSITTKEVTVINAAEHEAQVTPKTNSERTWREYLDELKTKAYEMVERVPGVPKVIQMAKYVEAKRLEFLAKMETKYPSLFETARYIHNTVNMKNVQRLIKENFAKAMLILGILVATFALTEGFACLAVGKLLKTKMSKDDPFYNKIEAAEFVTGMVDGALIPCFVFLPLGIAGSVKMSASMTVGGLMLGLSPVQQLKVLRASIVSGFADAILLPVGFMSGPIVSSIHANMLGLNDPEAVKVTHETALIDLQGGLVYQEVLMAQMDAQLRNNKK